MSVTLERLGRGAAYLLHDEATATTLLLGCGEARETLASAALPGDAKSVGSADDGSGYDSAESAPGAGAAGAPLARHARRYAHELRELMKRQGDGALTAVLVADYRPEACFMLPYLTEKCLVPLAAPESPPQLLPPILLTHGTRAIAPHHLAEYWTAHGKDKAQLYDAADIASAFRKTQPIALKARITVNDNVKVTAYHAGHVAGGCAFFIEIGATTILFAHDFNLGGGRVLLPAQIPRLEPSVLVTRSSFAVTVSETRTNMERELMRVVHECVSSRGKVVIPVYRLGFFQELLTILLAYWRKMQLTIPIFVSDEAMEYPSRFAPLVRRTFTDEFKNVLAQREQGVQGGAGAPDVQVFDWKRLQSSAPFVLFTGPASIAQGDSFRAIKACATDPKNLIVLSEHCTPGTANYSLYADPQRKEVSKRLGVNVTCGVHYFPCGDEVDARSIVELVAHVAPRHQVLLDYVVPEDMQFIKTHVLNRLKTRHSEGRAEPLLTVGEISQENGEPTLLQASREIPLKIHKSMFNNPFDVQGMLIAEGGAKRKLTLVTAGNGARRLKKKRHTLNFAFSWKKAPATSTRVKKKSARAPSSALAFLLSAPAESTDDDEEPEAQPQANVADLLDALHATLRKWLLPDTPIEQNDHRWLKVRSVAVSVSHEWEVHLEWSYEDEELAGRVLGIAKQVVHAEYAKTQE